MHLSSQEAWPPACEAGGRPVGAADESFLRRHAVLACTVLNPCPECNRFHMACCWRAPGRLVVHAPRARRAAATVLKIFSAVRPALPAAPCTHFLCGRFLPCMCALICSCLPMDLDVRLILMLHWSGGSQARVHRKTAQVASTHNTLRKCRLRLGRCSRLQPGRARAQPTKGAQPRSDTQGAHAAQKGGCTAYRSDGVQQACYNGKQARSRGVWRKELVLVAQIRAQNGHSSSYRRGCGQAAPGPCWHEAATSPKSATFPSVCFSF